MQTKFKIKKGDTVVVTAGRSKGREGEVLQVLRDRSALLVKGVNVVRKHQKDTPAMQGGIVSKEAPVHVSNVAIKDPKTGSATRVGYKMVDGKKVRFAKRSGELLDK